MAGDSKACPYDPFAWNLLDVSTCCLEWRIPHERLQGLRFFFKSVFWLETQKKKRRFGSRYITVDEAQNRSLYYYLVTSEGNPATDPLVLWLNGGPECSSFDGWAYEHGPFNFVPGVSEGDLPTLKLNPFI